MTSKETNQNKRPPEPEKSLAKMGFSSSGGKGDITKAKKIIPPDIKKFIAQREKKK